MQAKGNVDLPLNCKVTTFFIIPKIKAQKKLRMKGNSGSVRKGC